MDSIIGALKDLGEKKWVINILLPTVFFVSMAIVHLALINNNYTSFFLWWSGQSLEVKVVIGIVFALVCFSIATIFDFATNAILGLFTGFDSGFEGQTFFIRWIHGIGRSYYLRRYQEKNQRYQTIATKNELSYGEQQQLAGLEDDLHNFPVKRDRIRSTKLGNILSAVVEYTELRYGIDLRATWTRMVYSICPDSFRETLLESRLRLDLFLRLFVLVFIYTMLFSGYYFFLRAHQECILALGIGIFCLLMVLKWSDTSARDYAEMIRSMYDLYRFDLYESLRLPLPKKSGDAEIIAGKQLSEHLWRGTNEIKYSDIKKTE